MYHERLGENYKRTNPFNQIIREGVVICGGSDCDVTPANPLLGIHSAVNHPVESHRISVYEAIKMFTCNGAYSIFEEENKGTLEIERWRILSSWTEISFRRKKVRSKISRL